MKTLLFVIVCAWITACACTHQDTHPKVGEISWNEYCKAFNVDPNHPSEEEENYFLDAWRGSGREEIALRKYNLN